MTKIGKFAAATSVVMVLGGLIQLAVTRHKASSASAPQVLTPLPTPLPVPYPGFWHTGLNALYYQCNVIPYTIYNQPDDGTPSYVRFDYQVAKVSGTRDTPSGAVNHNPAFYTHDGRIIPVAHQPTLIDYGYFPRPTSAMRSSPPNPFPYDAALYWQNKNNGLSPDPPPTEAVYSAKIGSLAEWVDGNIAAFQLAKIQQCSAPIPTKTKTPAPVTPVPSRTPVPIPVTCVPTIVTRIVTRIVTAVPTPHFGPAPTKKP